MKQTEHFYIEAGHKVARAMQQKNLNRSKAAIQNFYWMNEAHRQH